MGIEVLSVDSLGNRLRRNLRSVSDLFSWVSVIWAGLLLLSSIALIVFAYAFAKVFDDIFYHNDTIIREGFDLVFKYLWFLRVFPGASIYQDASKKGSLLAFLTALAILEIIFAFIVKHTATLALQDSRHHYIAGVLISLFSIALVNPFSLVSGILLIIAHGEKNMKSVDRVQDEVTQHLQFRLGGTTFWRVIAKYVSLISFILATLAALGLLALILAEALNIEQILNFAVGGKTLDAYFQQIFVDTEKWIAYAILALIAVALFVLNILFLRGFWIAAQDNLSHAQLCWCSLIGLPLNPIAGLLVGLTRNHTNKYNEEVPSLKTFSEVNKLDDIINAPLPATPKIDEDELNQIIAADDHDLQSKVSSLLSQSDPVVADSSAITSLPAVHGNDYVSNHNFNFTHRIVIDHQQAAVAAPVQTVVAAPVAAEPEHVEKTAPVAHGKGDTNSTLHETSTININNYTNLPESGSGAVASGHSRFNPLLIPSKELAVIVGKHLITRSSAIKRVWEYIKKHELQDRTMINADDVLKTITDNNPRITMFEVPKYVGKNLSKPKVKAKLKEKGKD